jgi:hypothetical protein
MFRMTRSTDRLALMLSLPFAFLIWGCVSDYNKSHGVVTHSLTEQYFLLQHYLL